MACEPLLDQDPYPFLRNPDEAERHRTADICPGSPEGARVDRARLRKGLSSVGHEAVALWQALLGVADSVGAADGFWDCAFPLPLGVFCVSAPPSGGVPVRSVNDVAKFAPSSASLPPPIPLQVPFHQHVVPLAGDDGLDSNTSAAVLV